jgi:hypothetical protein
LIGAKSHPADIRVRQLKQKLRYFAGRFQLMIVLGSADSLNS